MTGGEVMQLFVIPTHSLTHPFSNTRLFSLGAADRLYVTPCCSLGLTIFQSSSWFISFRSEV